MNRQRRKEIQKVLVRIESAVSDFQSEIDDCKNALEDIYYEEEESFENLPESLQDGEKGEAMQNAMDNIQYAIDSIDEISDIDTEEIRDYLHDAIV